MATYNFAASRFYNAKSLFRTYSDNRGFPWKNMVGSLLLQVLTVAAVRMARPGWLFKTSKTTTAWWLAGVELWKYPIGHEMSNQWSRPTARHLPSSNTKLDRPGKLVASYNFAASLFCSAPSVFRILLDHLCSNATNDQQGLEEQVWWLPSNLRSSHWS